MTYTELLNLYKNNEFRKIDEDVCAKKFYLLRSISKKATLNKFCEKFALNNNLDEIFRNGEITEGKISAFIRDSFVAKTTEQIRQIESELNKMRNFDWGGSAENNLEKNIVNNVIKKTLKYADIEKALTSVIQKSVNGYTFNSWYNHWSSILVEEIFNSNKNVLPTIDLVEKIDFFVKGVPYDLKVTYFPEELMRSRIKTKLSAAFGSVNELTCCKKIAREIGITIPTDLEDRALTVCLQNLIKESIDLRAKNFIAKLNEIKNGIYDYYIENKNELIVWLYEHQGERRFDAANRFFVVLIDKENPFDSWKLKRNVPLLKESINKKLDSFDPNKLNEISFEWAKNAGKYDCYSEIIFVYK